MKTVGIISNIDKDPKLVQTDKIAQWLVGQGCRVLAPKWNDKIIDNSDVCYVDEDELYSTADFAVVLGGDGTILSAARKAAVYNTLLLGINFGTLGYLADVDKDKAIPTLEKVLKGEYSVESRMMLEAYMSGDEGNRYIALNEACITNTEFSRMITLSIEINGAYINTVKADGIIIATPTGSTAYNLSAGGPILNPDTELITLTYICPHTLTSRPLVLSGKDEISIKVDSRYNSIQVSCDGQKSLSLSSGDTVVVRRSDLVTRIIKTSNMNFYDILRHKMVDVGL